jgi:hypothetical protein
LFQCDGKLTRKNNAHLIQAWEVSNKNSTQKVASKAALKPTPVLTSTTQSASSVGKFDGKWKGEIVCDDISPSGFYTYDGEIALRIAGNNVSQIAWVAEQTERVINVTGMVLNNRRIEFGGKFIWEDDNGILTSADFLLSGKGSSGTFKIQGDAGHRHTCSGSVTRVKNLSPKLLASLNKSKRKQPLPQQVALNSSEESRKAALERQRLQQKIAALKKQNEEARLLIEAERIRQEEAKKLAKIERILKEKEIRRLAEAKRNSCLVSGASMPRSLIRE